MKAIEPVNPQPKPVSPAQLSPEERRQFQAVPNRIRYVYHPSFAFAQAEEKLFGASAPPINVPTWTAFPEAVEEGQDLCQLKKVSLTAKDEHTLFLRYNYARYRLSKLLPAPPRVSAARAREMILWHGRAMQARAALAEANMALVVTVAKRRPTPEIEFEELISEGNMALLRSVDKFDVARGFKFSTYAWRAILSAFARLAVLNNRYRRHFPTEFDPELETTDFSAIRDRGQLEDSVDDLLEALVKNRAGLNPVEKTVVLERFIFPVGGRGRTLAELGKRLGLSNERVRQIQNTTLGKLRAALS